MSDINNAIALNVNQGNNNLDLGKTFMTLAQLQMANAHAQLFGAQAQFQQNRVNALQQANELYRAGDSQGATNALLVADPEWASKFQDTVQKGKTYSTLASAGPAALRGDQGAMGQVAAVNPEAASTLATTRGRQVETTEKQGGMTYDFVSREAQRLMGIQDPNVRQREYGNTLDRLFRSGAMDENSYDYYKGHAPTDLFLGQVYKQAVDAKTQSEAVKTSPTEAVTPRGNLVQPGSGPVQPGGGGNLVGTNGQVGPLTIDKIMPTAPPVNAPVAQAQPGIGPRMTPREVSADQGAGAQDAKYSETIANAAQSARGVNATLGNMVRDAEKLPVGRGMTAVNEGRAWLQSMYENIPGLKSWLPDPAKDATAAYDSLVKNSGQLTRQALLQTHERAAIAYDMIQRQLPNVETSRGGLGHIAAEWMGLNDDAIAKQAVMSNRPVAGRSDAFEAEWNKNVNPVAFMVARMSPQDRTTVIKGLNQTEGGRQILADIKKTDTFLAKSGSPITPQGIQ